MQNSSFNQDSLNKFASYDKDTIEILEQLSISAIEVYKLLKQELINPNNINNNLTTNIHNEKQIPLDIKSNNIFKKNLNHHKLKYLISEEEINHIDLNKNGKYVIAIDPLDGSSNTHLNIGVGSIFCLIESNQRLPQFPFKIDICGFFVYSTILELFLTINQQELYHFTYTNENFKLSRKNITIPKFNQEFSINYGNYPYLEPSIQNFIDSLYKNSKWNLRYTGSLILDIRRILFKGGIFLYPCVIQNKISKPKLRFFYECLPLATTLKAAKGNSIIPELNLDTSNFNPKSIHSKTGIAMGSVQNIKELRKYLN